MSFYSNLAAVATRLLTDKGQVAAFSRETGGSFNPTTGSYSGQTTTAFSGQAAAFDYNKSEIDGDLVQLGDVRLILEPIATAPAPGDTVTVDSVVYRVMDVMASSPAGTITHYEVQLRK